MKQIDNEKEALSLSYRTKVDLRSSFPISRRYALRKTLGWLTAFAVTIGVVAALSYVEFNYLPQKLHSSVLPVLVGTGAIIAAKYAHAELYRATFYYGLEGFRLIISRGIVVSQIGSLPILPVSEVYIHRNLLDMLFGVANVDIYTPMETTRCFARIECLAPSTAKALQEFLDELLNVQIFTAPEAKQEIHYFNRNKPAAESSLPASTGSKRTRASITGLLLPEMVSTAHVRGRDTGTRTRDRA